MEQKYTDLYALFRHCPEAEEYFEHLPSDVQAKIASRYQAVDSFARLENFSRHFIPSFY